MSRLIDVWGLSQGLGLMVLFGFLALLLMIFCQNVGTYAAAVVIYEIGYGGILYTLLVFVTANARLKYRPLAIAGTKVPYIITTFAGPSVAEKFYTRGLIKWAFGTFAIIVPVIGGLMVGGLWHYQRSANRALPAVRVKARQKGNHFLRALFNYLKDFDVIGIAIACAGLTTFLLPFNLAASGINGWRSVSIISMIVVGAFLLVVLVLYEYFVAPKKFLPFELLGDRVVWGACLSICGVYMSLFCWFSYFTSQLQVVHNMSISEAGYLANTNYVGGGAAALATGLAMHYIGRARVTTLVALTVYTFGTGMMIHFSSSLSSSSVGGIIASQVLISLASGTHSVSSNVGILDGASPSTVSMRLALAYLSSMIGASIALAISGAIWTNTLPSRLTANLAGLGLSTEDKASIYGSLIVQISYEVGSPVRDAIDHSYREVFKLMMIAATASTTVGWIGALMLRDVTPRDRDAEEG